MRDLPCGSGKKSSVNMLSIEEVKSLRLWTQHLTDKTDKFTVVRDLNGLQAQFMSNAFHGLRIRCNEDLPEDDFGMGLVKNWTVRGTVHIFDKKDFLRFQIILQLILLCAEKFLEL